jgi:hypothetical protein
LPAGTTTASSPAGTKTAVSAFSPASSGCGWCGGVKQTKAKVEVKAKADGGDAERRCRQGRGGARGSGGWLCCTLLLLGRTRWKREREGGSSSSAGRVKARSGLQGPQRATGWSTPATGYHAAGLSCGRSDAGTRVWAGTSAEGRQVLGGSGPASAVGRKVGRRPT